MYQQAACRMYRYLVTYDAEKKVVSVQDKTTLGDAIGRKFRLESSSFTLQSWYDEFNEWVGVDDFTELPDSCKLHVLLTGQPSRFLHGTYSRPWLKCQNYLVHRKQLL